LGQLLAAPEATKLGDVMLDYDQILPELFIGSHLESGDDIDRLKNEAGVTAVLNLQTHEDDLYWKRDWLALANHYYQCGVEIRRVPIRDFDQTDLGQQLPDGVSALNELLAAGHVVYIHCTAGVWRAPTVVVAYLHWCRGWELEKAIAYVKQHRPCSPSFEAIRRATLDLVTNEAMRQKFQRVGK
jgi:protein-tyrosine phosphatase